MKKTVPIFLAGVLFIVTFIGLIEITHISGLWVQREGRPGGFEAMEGGKPAGRSGQSEDEIEAMTEHFANMKISEFCKIAEINTECAMSKLGIDSLQLETTFDAVAKAKGTTIAKMVELIQACSNGGGDQENGPEEEGDDL